MTLDKQRQDLERRLHAGRGGQRNFFEMANGTSGPETAGAVESGEWRGCFRVEGVRSFGSHRSSR